MIDPAMLLQQIFGKQAAQPMQISGQTGMGPTGPSKFQQFGSLLSVLGQGGAAGMPGAGGAASPIAAQPNGQDQNRKQAMMLLKSMFGGRGGPSGGGMSRGGGSGDGMTQARRGGTY